MEAIVNSGAWTPPALSGRPCRTKPDRRKRDRISNPRTAVFIGLIGVLALLFAGSADAGIAMFSADAALTAGAPVAGVNGRAGGIPVRRAAAKPGHILKDPCNARDATLVDSPLVPEAGVVKLHTRRVVVDGYPESGFGEPATRASRHRPAATAGRCFSVALSIQSAAD